MIRQIIFTIILLGGYLSSSVFAVGQGATYRLLREPAVKWNDGRLEGEIKNAPVKNLITELLQRAGTKGTNWEVIGNLKGNINISFNNLTINESIKKVMRLNRFNYALIFDEWQSQGSKHFHRIKELTIYQEDQAIRFYRTSKQIQASREINSERTRKPATSKPTVVLPASPAAAKPKTQGTRPAEATSEEIAAMDKELQTIADEMLADEIITQEEYDALMEEIEAEKKE